MFLTEAQVALVAEAMHPAYDLGIALGRRPGRLPTEAVGGTRGRWRTGC